MVRLGHTFEGVPSNVNQLPLYQAGPWTGFDGLASLIFVSCTSLWSPLRRFPTGHNKDGSRCDARQVDLWSGSL